MLYELRIYTCKPGSVNTVLEMWEREGKDMIEPYMEMVGQWISESGTANQIYTLWRFESFEARRQSRTALIANAQFNEYLTRARAYYEKQEVVFLGPTAISPLQ